MAEDPDLRRAAQDERDKLKKIIAGGAFAIGGVGILTVAVALPPLALVGFVPGLIVWRSGKELVDQERLVEDPPRFDFESSAQARYERLNEAYFEVGDLPGELLLRYCQGSVGIVALLGAMIRSVERAMGAEERGERSFAEARSEEAQGFAFEIGGALEETATAMEEIGALLRTAPFAQADELMVEAGITPPSDILGALPDAAAAALYRVGTQANIFSEFPSYEADAPEGRPLFLSSHKP